MIEKVKPDFPDLRVTYLDATEHTEILEKYRIMSALGIIVNGKLEYTGGLDEASFRELLTTLSHKSG